MKKKIWMLVMCVVMLITLLPANADASVKSENSKKKSLTKNEYIKKTADAVDIFVKQVLSETQSQVDGKYPDTNVSKKKFLSELKKIYGGKLKSRQKSMIAASQVSSYSWTSPEQIVPIEVGTVSAKKVQKKFEALFGTKNQKIDLPIVTSNTELEKYYLGYAKDVSSEVYVLAFENEREYESEILDVEKKGKSNYIITLRYKFYSHWGIKANGEKPTQTVTVKIKVKKKASSSYKYNIKAIIFE